MFLIPSLMLALVAGALTQGDFGVGVHDEIRNIEVGARAPYTAEYVCQKPELKESDIRSPECIVNSFGVEPSILLWGDSNAAHYVGLLGELAKHYRFSFRNIAHSACPPLLGSAERFTPAQRVQACRKSNKIVIPSLAEYEMIILSGAWGTYLKSSSEQFKPELAATISTLIEDGHKVLLIGQIPRLESVDRQCPQKKVKLKFLNCQAQANGELSSVFATNEEIRKLAEDLGASYIDFNDALCEGQVCSGYFKDQLLYFDKGHLSVFGSVKLGEQVVDQGIGQDLFVEVQEGD